MATHAHLANAALIIAVTLMLGACGQQADQPAPVTASTSTPASAAAFPAGNAQPALSLADCDKLPDPKAPDESPTARAIAVSMGAAARRDCKRTIQRQDGAGNADLARIREIKEKEQADQASREKSSKEWFGNVKQAGKAPLKEFKY